MAAASKSGVPPVDREPAIRVVEPRAIEARQRCQAALDVADAGGAGDALDRKIETREPSSRFDKGGVVDRGDIDTSTAALAQDDPAARPEHPLAAAHQLDDEVPLAQRDVLDGAA